MKMIYKQKIQDEALLGDYVDRISANDDTKFCTHCLRKLRAITDDSELINSLGEDNYATLRKLHEECEVEWNCPAIPLEATLPPMPTPTPTPTEQVKMCSYFGLYKCDQCGTIGSTAWGVWRSTIEPYAEALNIKMFKRGTPYQRKTVGVSFNEKTDTLSLWGSDLELYGTAAHKKLFRKPVFRKVSLNVKTGKILSISKGSIFKTQNEIRRIDQGNGTSAIGYSHDDHNAVIAFLAEAVKYIPLKAEVEIRDLNVTKREEAKYQKPFLVFPDLGVTVGGFDEALMAIAKLISEPNKYLAYDKFKNSYKLRESLIGKTLFYNEEVEIASWRLLYQVTIPSRFSIFSAIQPKEIMDEGDYIEYMVKSLKIPASRNFKKLYRQRPYIMDYMYYFHNTIGIKAPDNLKKLLEVFCFDHWNVNSQTTSLIRHLVKANGETRAVNQIVLACQYMRNMYIMDSARMHSLIVNKKRLPFNYSGSLKEVHDRLSKMVRGLDLSNREIEYSEKEKSREGETEGVSIKLPEDTAKLSDIGKAMHICVGQYGDSAVKKECTIYYMENTDGKYVGCIEMSRNTLVQAKGYCNKMLQGKTAQALKAWVETKKITAKKCYDYQQALAAI